MVGVWHPYLLQPSDGLVFAHGTEPNEVSSEDKGFSCSMQVAASTLRSFLVLKRKQMLGRANLA